MDLGLRDRVCIVTGSTGGIGLATARMLADEGARVLVSGRDPDRVERAREDVRAALDTLLTGKPVPSNQKASIGCNIKWKPGNEPDYFG